MAVIHGNITQRVRVRRVQDSQSGNSWEHEWICPVSGLAALAASLIAGGARVRDESANGVGRLVATYSFDPDETPSSEVPVDRYDIDMEQVQVSLFNHPAAAQEITAFGLANPEAGESGYRRGIEAAIAAGDAFPINASVYPIGREIYRLLSRGVEAYEIHRPVLSRVRTFSPAFAPRIVLSAVETVYTTAALVRDFAIPSIIAAQLPADPPEVPEGTVWAWKLRGDRSTYIPSQNRVEETRDWVFAAWSTLLYTVTT